MDSGSKPSPHTALAYFKTPSFSALPPVQTRKGDTSVQSSTKTSKQNFGLAMSSSQFLNRQQRQQRHQQQKRHWPLLQRGQRQKQQRQEQQKQQPSFEGQQQKQRQRQRRRPQQQVQGHTPRRFL